VSLLLISGLCISIAEAARISSASAVRRSAQAAPGEFVNQMLVHDVLHYVRSRVHVFDCPTLFADCHRLK